MKSQINKNSENDFSSWKKIYNDEQKRAINSALTNNISIINKEKNPEISIPEPNQMININISNKKVKIIGNNINDIDNNNNFFVNERTTINHKGNNKINTSNSNFSISRVSKAKTTIPNYNASKFENYNIQKIDFLFQK